MKTNKVNNDLDKLEILSSDLDFDLVEEYFNILFENSNNIDQIVNFLNINIDFTEAVNLKKYTH